MPVRVGIDLVSVKRVEESVRTHGSHYLERIYTTRELGDCRTAAGVDSSRLAARFAAKEATLKVLRPQPDQSVPWHTIEVRRHGAGWVDLELSGEAASLAHEAGLSGLALSLSHEEGMASAVVVGDLSSRQPQL